MTAPAPVNTITATRRTVRLRRWWIFCLSWLLLSVLSIAWSITTPVSASPDEPAHIIKAASVARGQFIGEPSPDGHIVQVPRYIASTQAETCFAFQPNIAADCAIPLTGPPSEVISSSTTAGLYNPVYYLLVGWPSLLIGDATGIYVMRAVSGILASLFLAFTVLIAYGWRRNILPLAALGVAVPPMLLFLNGSVNPNGVETTATLAVFTAMLAIVMQPNERLLAERSLILLAGAAVAVNARGLSPLWVLVAIFTPLLLISWTQIWKLLRKPMVLVAVGGTAATTAFALFWLAGTNSLASAVTDKDASRAFPGVGASPITGFVNTIRETFGYAQTMIGNFGWLDTPAPATAYFVWAVFAGVLLLAGFSVLRGRRLLFAAVLVGLYLLVPPVIQAAYITGGGMIWQGRYNLPLFAMFAFGVAVVLAERLPGLDEAILARFSLLIWLGWLLAQYLSFATALKRYAVGSNGSWKDVLLAPEWSAPLGNLVWLAGFGLLTAASAWLAWRAGREHSLRPAS